jgi:hypothetical protein
VLEQVAQVFARQHAKELAATPQPTGELKVDDRRSIAGPAEPIRLLREVVVHHAVPMQVAQQLERARKKRSRARPSGVERLAGQECPPQHGAVEVDQLGQPLRRTERLEDRGLARGETAREPAGATASRTCVALDDSSTVARDQADRAEAVGFQSARDRHRGR